MHTIHALPAHAKLPINRCNLPASIVGSLAFHRHPKPLFIDGVNEIHKLLFEKLEHAATASARGEAFTDYMSVYFRLHALDAVGHNHFAKVNRARADYRNVLRGWFFSPDGREGAVLKSWVESRFGLTTRFHKQHFLVPGSAAYDQYLEDRTAGLYNTNALESQLDLVYSYCQYELSRLQPRAGHWRLYRGINKVDALETLDREGDQRIVLLNNVNSFSRDRERASEFGDIILAADVPLEKIFYYSGLLPVHTVGEAEVITLGGLYEIEVSYV